MTDPQPNNSPTPENAPDGFWEDFGKFAAGKLGLFDEFVKSKNSAPAPEPKADDDPAPTPTPKKQRKSWFGDE